MIPSMWRVELFHPLTVHFPIALLIVGTAFRLIGALWSRPDRGFTAFLYSCGQLMTGVGVLAAWAAWYTGGLAEEEVNSNLCDPTLTHLHGDLAFYVALIFSFIIMIDVAGLVLVRSRLRVDALVLVFHSKGFRLALSIAAVSGSCLLGYVGHLGAGLTYNQAAAVYHPTPQCSEFEASGSGIAQ